MHSRGGDPGDDSAVGGRRLTRTWWLAAPVLGGLLVVMIAAAASSVAPLRVTCDPALTADVCRDTVVASRSRGLAPFHPLVVSAHVRPGPAAATNTSGHRATVAFDLLGVPGPTTVRMYYDIGGHWGGVTDRGAAELALWALIVPLIVVGMMALALFATVRAKRADLTGRQG